MMHKERLFLIFLATMTLIGCIQQKNIALSNRKNKNEFESHYRDSLINVAKLLIAKKVGHSIPRNYKSKVYKDSSNLWVFFSTKVQYAPINSLYNYNAEVELNSKTLSYQTINNSKKKLEGQSVPFYKMKTKDFEKIGFIAKALNVKNPLESDQHKLYELFRIIEKESFYEVVIETSDTKSEYTVTKLNGKVKSLGHRHIKIPSLSERGLIEIK